jgi:hypothetical protein
MSGCVALAFLASPAHASLVLTTGLGTTQVGNLVQNGSFEIGAPPSGLANKVYWATGTANAPLSVPPGWMTSGGPTNYALWGNDGTSPQSMNGSDQIPDGVAAVYFGNGGPVIPNAAPTFNNDGSVSFSSPPTFFTPYGPPVILQQTINTVANPSPSYKFSFWTSGEDAIGPIFGERGIFGLRVTNVLPGDPMQWLTVPNGGANPTGLSHLYEYTFTPLNNALPVTIEFHNLGHLDLSAYGMSNFTTELVLDNVIINVVPEPASLMLLSAGSLLILRRRRNA